MQSCWLVLGVLYYHYEVTDFLEPVTEEMFGPAIYEEYCAAVRNPMDIGTVMAKVRSHSYPDKYAFRRDVLLIFENCREFNEPDTEIVQCANNLEAEFERQWRHRGL